MVKTAIRDKTMLVLVLALAFFVGGTITEVFYDYNVEAKTGITNINLAKDLGFALSDTSDRTTPQTDEHV
jgi:hypothetical protein